MELTSLLKVLINHFKKPYVIFTAVWVLISLLMFIPFPFIYELKIVFISLYIICSSVFSLYISYIIYGSYAKTLAQIQNNRKIFILNAFIISLIHSIELTCLFILLRINNNEFIFNPLSFKSILIIFSSYLLIFYVGGLYGIFVSNNKKVNKYFIILLLLAILIVAIFISPLTIDNIYAIINFTFFNNYNNILLFNICFDIASICLCSGYYLLLNISKTYMNEE